MVLLGRDFAGGGARDREFRRIGVDLGDRLSMDDPGAACLALSDALAQIADTFGPQ